MRTSETVYVHSLLEPTDIIHGSRPQRSKPALAANWDWLNSLSPEQRKQMQDEAQQELERTD